MANSLPPYNPQTTHCESTVDAQQLILLIQQHCEQHGLKLTPSRFRVLQALAIANVHLKAYAILDRVRRAHPSAAAPAIYRALEFLRSEGWVIKLNTINAFLLQLPGPSWQSTYLVCERCESVKVVEAPALREEFLLIDQVSSFTPATRALEVAGICQTCRQAALWPTACAPPTHSSGD